MLYFKFNQACKKFSATVWALIQQNPEASAKRLIVLNRVCEIFLV